MVDFVAMQYFVLFCSLIRMTFAGKNSIVYSSPANNTDFVIGGLIPLHLYNEVNQTCGTLRELGSLRRVEALAYAVGELNDNENILPNITLGYEIYDTCSYDSETLKNSLRFIPEMRGSGICKSTAGRRNNSGFLIGAVGAQRSSSSIQAATLLGLYDIPLVSFLSTSNELSRDERYPYFFRTVPPDKYQVNAMIQIMLNFNWTYVVFLNSDDTYGFSAKTEFANEAERAGICIAYSDTIMSADNANTYMKVADRLLKLQSESLLSVVVLFVQQEMARKLFGELSRRGETRKFIWIGSDGWGNYGLDPVVDFEEAALGAITIVPKSGTLPMFEEYFSSLRKGYSRNPWLNEFLETYHCHEESADPACPNAMIGTSADAAHESLVIDSVNVLALALNEMILDTCNQSKLCDALFPFDRPKYKEYILNINFTSQSNGEVTFTSNGDSKGKYRLRHLHFTGNEYMFTDVGDWEEGVGINFIRNLSWYIERDNNLSTPISVCSLPCQRFQVKNVLPDRPCCWECVDCTESEIILDEFTCYQCFDEFSRDEFKWPNPEKTACIEINTLTLLDKPGMIAILAFSVLGFSVNIFVTVTYYYNREHTLIKASSRELSFLILVGISILYLSAMLFCIDPMYIICSLLRLLPLVGSSFIYVPLVLMTVRLYRIFQAGRKSAGRPNFISPKSQIFLSLLISVFPIIWSIVWIILEPPKVRIIPPTGEKYAAVRQTCTHSSTFTIGQISWDLLIVTVCCFFAILTRNLPANYNQTRFIAFSVFTTLIVYLAFAPAFFTSRDEQRDLYNALGAALQSTVILVCIFMVKLYAIRFVKEEDQHALASSRRGFPSQGSSPMKGQSNVRSISQSLTSISDHKNPENGDVLPEKSQFAFSSPAFEMDEADQPKIYRFAPSGDANNKVYSQVENGKAIYRDNSKHTQIESRNIFNNLKDTG